MELLRKIRGQSGWIILSMVFLVALGRVFFLDARQAPSGKKIIKISHWQMEAGVREALDDAAREYQKLHPDVEIQQIIVGGSNYVSWITTRLIGGAAPDIIALGNMDRGLMLELFQRYFVPLSGEIGKPNPYNAGTSLEGVPWKATYYDDMLGGYMPELIEYYQVPESAFTMRLFYNKTKFREATGLDAPPSDFRAFLGACQQIKEYGRAHGEALVPIANAGKYNAKFIWSRFDQAVNSTLLPAVDVNLDSEQGPEESLIALVGGAVDFRDRRIRAMIEGHDYYNKQCQPAFFAADRMDAAFLFLQQRALMIASGSWDARSYVKQAEFEVGVCDFPMPARDDPEFGKFVEGVAVEELLGGFSFGVNRLSPNADVALDFLKFLSSQRINGKLNEEVQWIPMIRGNKPVPFIAPFWPHFDGVKAGIQLSTGGLNSQLYDELANLNAAGRLNYEGFLKRFLPSFVANGDRWMRQDRQRSWQLAANQDEFVRMAERMKEEQSGQRGSKADALLENEVSRRYNAIELSRRYEEARQASPLPKPSEP